MGAVTVDALRDVSLEIMEGELMVVLGPSGSGKSTLLNLIGGLDAPTAGRVLYRQRDLSRGNGRQLTAYRRTEVGFVFQFFNLIADLTARENVLAAAELVEHPLDPDEVLDWVGLAERAGHFPSQLSGGEQQRVAIARALVKDPPLILCDEPTGALDDVTGKEVLRILCDLKERRGKTVVLITHNTAISAIADRIVRLKSGRIAELVRPAEPARPEDVEW